MCARTRSHIVPRQSLDGQYVSEIIESDRVCVCCLMCLSCLLLFYMCTSVRVACGGLQTFLVRVRTCDDGVVL